MENRGSDEARFDEKSALLSSSAPREVDTRGLPQPQTQQKQRFVRRALVLLLILCVWWSAVTIEDVLSRTDPRHGLKEGGPHDNEGSGDKMHVSFQDITPSRKLEWHPCFNGLYCARLAVAMDYHRPLDASSSHPQVAVALVLVPSITSSPHTHSTSPLLLNPGGPGGSGVAFTVGAGQQLQQIVGADRDIIGFDPRGIGFTTPRADCFGWPSEGEFDYLRGEYSRIMWATAGREIGLVNSSQVALQKLDTRARALGKLCGEKDAVDAEESILKYVSTPNVARDMVSIIDAWDEWVEEEAKLVEKDIIVEDGDLLDEPQGEYSLDTKGKLVYWGFSYGTLLGATFSAMFPDRVGRVVLDGVVDADYYVSPVWAESLLDADADLASFFTYCHAAGEQCALFRPGDKPSDIEDRFQSVLTRIRNQPLTLVDEVTLFPTVIYESDVRMLVFQVLYSPTAAFPALASVFDQLYRGNDDVMRPFIHLIPFGGLGLFCGTPHPEASDFANEEQIAIMCSDKRYPLNGTVADLEVLFDKMANISSWADVWMNLMLGCDGWPIEQRDPPMRWDDHPARKQKPINTSYPLLFVSNTADPVTPLYAGVKMAKKFVDAGLIEQKSEGHCSIAASSRCTMGKIQAYFRDGVVPAPPVLGEGEALREGKWDRCEAETWPWHNGAEVASMSLEEQRVVTAVEHVQRELTKYFTPQMRGKGALSLEKLKAFDFDAYEV